MQNMQRALLARGASPADAMLAASSPEAFKALLSRLWPTYSAHNVGDVSGSFNPATGDFKPQYAAPKFEKVGEGDSLYNVTPSLNGSAPAGAGRLL
jgi:hypothetical protein